MARLVELDRFGKKTGGGFYIIDTTKGFESLSALLEREYPDRVSLSVEEGFKQMMYGMVNEAFLCLEEEISSADEIETGCTYGIGFPMTLEGLLHWAEKEGLQNILTYLKQLFEQTQNPRFKPSQLLEQYVAEEKTIFKDNDDEEKW